MPPAAIQLLGISTMLWAMMWQPLSPLFHGHRHPRSLGFDHFLEDLEIVVAFETGLERVRSMQPNRKINMAKEMVMVLDGCI